MPPATSYTAEVSRDGSCWTVHLPGLGRCAPAARLAQAEGTARDLVVTFTHQDPATFRIDLELAVGPALAELVHAAEAARADADRVSVAAVALRRRLARGLAALGLPVRDVAGLLGISYARALLLLAEVARPDRARVGAVPVPAQRAEPPAERLPGSHDSYRHEAVTYRGADGFLAGTVGFVRGGIALGQPVMVAVVPERLAALRAALPSPEAERVRWVDMTEVGANPARIIPAWRAFVDEHSGQPVRGVGEPVWAGRRPAEVVECQLHESLLNLALEPDTPLWLRCPYDADALGPQLLEEAARSHPALVDGADYRGSTSCGGVDHAGGAFAAALPEPAGEVGELPFDHATLGVVRPEVLARAAAAGLDEDKRADLALALTEAATNSIRHGGGRGVLRVWEQDGALVCEVRDAGRIDDLLAGRRAPALHAESGRGLWLVHQLGDLVQVRSAGRGSTVRVFSWL